VPPRITPLSVILAMLESCAKGFTHRPSTHSILVRFNDKVFALQRGSKKESDPDILTQNVRKMVRQLVINKDCANNSIPDLGIN
jgi:hypothetical protein